MYCIINNNITFLRVSPNKDLIYNNKNTFSLFGTKSLFTETMQILSHCLIQYLYFFIHSVNITPNDNINERASLFNSNITILNSYVFLLTMFQIANTNFVLNIFSVNRKEVFKNKLYTISIGLIYSMIISLLYINLDANYSEFYLFFLNVTAFIKLDVSYINIKYLTKFIFTVIKYLNKYYNNITSI